METYKPEQSTENLPTPEEVMESFYKKFFDNPEKEVKRITLEQLQELKEQGITTENFLDYLCKTKGILLHGSIHEINEGKLKSDSGKIFAANKSAIAIMKSLYSNKVENQNINLEYPYSINADNPLILKIHTPPNGKFIHKKNGYIYIVNGDGFKNEPEGSWQFIKEAEEIEFSIVVETEDYDFKYPVELHDDLD